MSTKKFFPLPISLDELSPQDLKVRPKRKLLVPGDGPSAAKIKRVENETGTKPQNHKFKLFAIPTNPAEWEDSPPNNKVKTNFTKKWETKGATSARKGAKAENGEQQPKRAFKPFVIPSNPADWEDVFAKSKGMGTDKPKRTNEGKRFVFNKTKFNDRTAEDEGTPIFVKPKKKKTIGIRKELFNSSQKKHKQSHKIEKEVHKVIRTYENSSSLKRSSLLLENVRFSGISELPNISMSNDDLHPFSQDSSSTEDDFISNEKLCKVDGCKENGNANQKKEAVLQKMRQQLVKLKENAAAFMCELDSLFQNIEGVLEDDKENNSSNVQNREMSAAPSDATTVPPKKNLKKSVAFNEPLLTSVANEMKQSVTEDKCLNKAVEMYNSYRNNYRTLLSTPKQDRLALLTPRSQRKRQDSVSRRLQKQCLMLIDTPLVKK